jgi:hypothetical protein
MRIAGLTPPAAPVAARLRSVLHKLNANLITCAAGRLAA